MRRLLLLSLIAAACASGPSTQPNDREWGQIMSDYAWIESVRKAQPAPPPNAPRKQMIEMALDTQRKLEPTYAAFIDKVKEYHDRTHDPRAATLLAREKILMGDEYMDVLSRYDKALEFYRAAVQLDPMYAEANQRVATAESRRFVSITAFANVHAGMNAKAGIAYGAAPVRPRSRWRQAAHSMLGPAARARLSSERYAWPVELWVLRSMSRLKNAIGLRTVRTHVTQS